MSKRTLAKSLAEATRGGRNLKELYLKKSEDLRCVNLMCEKISSPAISSEYLTLSHLQYNIKKVGEACICRLARVLTLTPNLEKLDLSDNALTNIPDEILRLKKLRHLDLSSNNISKIPEELSILERESKLTIIM